MPTLTIPVQTLRTSTPGLAPTTGQLLEGQLAINMVDLKLYFKDHSNTIQRLGVSLSDLATVATTGNYNDLINKPSGSSYTLPPATTTTLGGVIVSTGLAVTGTGTLTNTGVLTVNTRSGNVTLTSTDVGIPTDLLSGASGTLASKYLPASVTGALTYQGLWNASTNTPTLASGVGTKGFFYVVSVAGTTNLDGITTWNAGDYAIFDGTEWTRLQNGSAVTSVNGQTGSVSITPANLGLATVATSGSYLDLTNRPAAYVLPQASTTVLGGIIVGTGLSISSGVLSTVGDLTVADPGLSAQGNPNLFQPITRPWTRAIQFPNAFLGSVPVGTFLSGTNCTIKIMKLSPASNTSGATQVGTITIDSVNGNSITSVGTTTNFAIGDAMQLQFVGTNLATMSVTFAGHWQ
jgi:hypothetical protein